MKSKKRIFVVEYDSVGSATVLFSDVHFMVKGLRVLVTVLERLMPKRH
jgi:hypothetical protein